MDATEVLHSHTPAPWVASSPSEVTGEVEIYAEATGRTIARIRDDGNAFGNAKLLERAPEMLAELRRAEAALRWAAQESAGRVRKEIVGGFLHHAADIRRLIFDITDSAA